MKKKILFFGLGSIGTRHAKLLLEHFDVDIAAYRTGETSNSLGVKEFTRIEDAFDFGPDIAFITNPSHLHTDTAIECAERSVHLFIEKPLSTNVAGLDILSEHINRNKVISYVAFCMKFHPVIDYLKRKIDIKKVFYSRVISSSFLPLWRPGKDYSKNYSAHLEKGGGVLNEMVHEPDYCEYLFGRVSDIRGNIGKFSELDVSADDAAELYLTHETGICCHISVDYFSHHRERSITIYTPDEVIIGDMVNMTISCFRNHKLVEEVLLEYEDMYLRQLEYFFSHIDTDNPNMISTVENCKNLVYHLSKLRSHESAGR